MSHSPNSGPVVLAPLAILRAFLPISLSASASFFPLFYHYSFLSLLSICLLPSTSTELSPTITSFTKSSAMAILPFSSNLSLPIVNLISLASHIYDFLSASFYIFPNTPCLIPISPHPAPLQKSSLISSSFFQPFALLLHILITLHIALWNVQRFKPPEGIQHVSNARLLTDLWFHVCPSVWDKCNLF